LSRFSNLESTEDPIEAFQGLQQAAMNSATRLSKRITGRISATVGCSPVVNPDTRAKIVARLVAEHLDPPEAPSGQQPPVLQPRAATALPSDSVTKRDADAPPPPKPRAPAKTYAPGF
jgi:predicted Zn-dependent protease